MSLTGQDFNAVSIFLPYGDVRFSRPFSSINLMTSLLIDSMQLHCGGNSKLLLLQFGKSADSRARKAGERCQIPHRCRRDAHRSQKDDVLN